MKEENINTLSHLKWEKNWQRCANSVSFYKLMLKKYLNNHWRIFHTSFNFVLAETKEEAIVIITSEREEFL